MGKTLSEVKQDIYFNLTPIATTQSDLSKIEILPPAGTVCSFGWNGDGTALTGYTSSGATVWVVSANSVSGMSRFCANLIKINATTAYFIACDGGATLVKIGILNLQTGGISSIVTVTNPTIGFVSYFGMNNACFYGQGSIVPIFRLKNNGNFILTGGSTTGFYEFTTAGANVSEGSSGAQKGFYFSADETCSVRRIGATDGNCFDIEFIYDKYNRTLTNKNIQIGRGVSIGVASVDLYLFGDHAVFTAGATYTKMFLRTEMDKLLKRAVLESGGRLS